MNKVLKEAIAQVDEAITTGEAFNSAANLGMIQIPLDRWQRILDEQRAVTASGFNYTQTQPYQLGKAYTELGRLLMDPATKLTQLAGSAQHLGFGVGVQIIPRKKDHA